jgi:transposase
MPTPQGLISATNRIRCCAIRTRQPSSTALRLDHCRAEGDGRLAEAMQDSDHTLRLSHSYLGAQFRRLRTKLGAPVAIKPMAAKLARLVYRMLRYGMPFIDRCEAFYESQHRKLQINYLKRKAANLGFQIIEAPAA